MYVSRFKTRLTKRRTRADSFHACRGYAVTDQRAPSRDKNNGGVAGEIKKIAALAEYFRERINDFPFEIVSESMSNAVTPLHPLTASAYDVFTVLKDEYGIWVCPNGGDLKEKIFRVGHIGCLTTADYDTLISAFEDLKNAA